MTSEVEICNLALSNVRGGSINSLDEASITAQTCKLKYPFLRDRVLREMPWQFNRKIKALAELTIDIFNWAYAYQYPKDCLKTLRIVPSFEEISAGSSDVVSRMTDPQMRSIMSLRRQVPYEVFNVDGGKVIGTNEPEARIDYAAKITDPNLFSDDFVLALSHLLAAEIAIPIVGGELGRGLRKESLGIYQGYLKDALINDLNDGFVESSESEFVTIRN